MAGVSGWQPKLHGQGGNKTWVKIPERLAVGVVSRRTVYTRNCVVLHMERSIEKRSRNALQPAALFKLMEQKGKYITKSKRIRQLEKQVEELQKQIEALTIYLDQSHQMLLRSNPRLAESLKRDWEEFNPPPPTPKQPKQRYKTLPLLPRADLVLTRDSSGRLVASPRPNKV